MAPPCLQPLCRWHVCIKTGMVFPTQSYFRVFRGSNIPRLRVHSCPFVSIRGSNIPSFRFFACFVCFVVQVFPDFVVHSCPFVSIRGSNIPSFRVHSCPFVSIRVHSCPFVVQVFPDFVVHSCPFVVQIFPVFVVHSCPFVSIRVHSWFKYSQTSFFRVSRVFRGSSIPSFRVHSWSRPAGFRKKSGFWRDGTIFPEYIKSAMDPRGFSSKTATLQQG